ncbi:MAG: ADP-dependent NAD(P)H-hydrate dehydratase / NAD(P)H-hydrate epimerase [Frankiaceae bacterium]|nr:ADP-dependent NAD(P)H-hydrate dehydratase / NAD(P)H-hydrate epimerase [Frankiaceae bacterium]
MSQICRPAYDSDAIRAAEAPLLATLPDHALMQRAAVGLARVCAQLLGRVYGARVVLLVGSGNNGGDALYAGAWLARRGAAVVAVATGNRVHEGGRDALLGAGGRLGGVEALDSADLVLDGLVGIGASGRLRGDTADLVSALNSSAALIVAVDVPSGVDASSGRVAGAAVRADVTVTFGAWKPGLFIDPGAAYAGSVELIDVGLDLPPSATQLLDDAGMAALLPAPVGDVTKYTRGVLGVAAGSDRYPGAAVLAVSGALAAGPGMVRYAGGAAVSQRVLDHFPEVVVAPEIASARVQAWVVGSGLGEEDDAAAAVRAVLATDVPVLVDADGLRTIREHPELLRRGQPVVLTPHAGELSRLTGEDRASIEADRLRAVRDAADRFGAVVLLKGSTTVIAAPGGETRINTTGSPWLGTAGTGDVLSGAIGAYLAQGLGALDAAAVGAYVHGRAAQLATAGGVPLRSGTLATSWHDAVRSIR